MRGLISIIALCFLLLSGCSTPAEEPQTVVRGEADFGSRPLNAREELIALDGDWLFVPGRFVDPGEAVPNGEGLYVRVPQSWYSLRAIPELDRGTGFGTYRMRIQLHPDDVGKPLGLLVKPIASSYRLWINGELARTVGIAGEDAASSSPASGEEHVYFVPGQNTVDITVQAANFSQRKGGIWDSLWIGSEAALDHSVLQGHFREFGMAGALIMMGIFYVTFSLFYLPERSTLFLGILSICIALRTFFLGETLVAVWFPSLSWTWQVKLEYFIEIGAILVFGQYFRAMYPEETPNFVIRFVQWFEGTFLFIVLITPPLFFTRLLPVHIAGIIIGVFLISFVFMKAIRHKRLGARSGFIALITAAAATVTDTLYYMSIPVWSVELVYPAYFLFLFTQMSVTIRRYVMLKKESDALNRKLAASNEQLERKVAERTRLLTDSHRANSRLMHSIAHDLRAPITLIRHRVDGLKPHVRSDGSLHLSVIEQQSDWALRLAQNLNDLASFQENEMNFSPTQVEAVDLMRFLYKRSEPIVRGGGFKWRRKPLDELLESEQTCLSVDMFLIERALDNLISNSLKFTTPEGEIAISYHKADDYFEIYLENDSVTLPAETLSHMFERFYKGDNSDLGSGIGLAVCWEIVVLHRGEIEASQPRKNRTCFTVRLPWAATGRRGKRESLGMGSASAGRTPVL